MIERNEDGTYSMNKEYQQKVWADMELYGCEEYGPVKPKKKYHYNPTYQKKRHKAGQAYIESKKTPCEHCGSTKNIHFHHTDPATKSSKSQEVSQLTTCTFTRIQEEIDKCICLCGSCHIRHHRIWDWRT